MAGARNRDPSTRGRSKTNSKREPCRRAVSDSATIALASMPDRPLAMLVEIAEVAVADGKAVPLTGTDAFQGNVSRRQLRRQLRCRPDVFQLAVDDPLRPEVFGAVHSERKFGHGAVVDHFPRQEVFRPKDNEKDLADIPKNVLDTLDVYMVQTMDEVLKIALTEPVAGRLPAAEEQAEPGETVADDTIT